MRGPIGGGSFGTSVPSGPSAIQIFDSGPVGTWELDAAAPAYYRDSWNKARVRATASNPTLAVVGTYQATGTAAVSVYVNGVFQSTQTQAMVAGVQNTISAPVVCAPNDVIELRANERFTLFDVTGPRSYVAAPAAPAKQLIIFGDSIAQQFQAVPGNNCWANLLVDDPPGPSWRIIDGGFTGAAAFSGIPANAAAYATARAFGTVKNVVLIALGVNDFNLGVSLANFNTVYTSLVANVRAALPGCGLCFVTQLIGGANDTATNPIALTPPPYRSVVTTIAAGYADKAVIDGLAIMTNADEADGNTHPNNSGMLKYKNAVKAQLLATWGA